MRAVLAPSLFLPGIRSPQFTPTYLLPLTSLMDMRIAYCKLLAAQVARISGAGGRVPEVPLGGLLRVSLLLLAMFFFSVERFTGKETGRDGPAGGEL